MGKIKNLKKQNVGRFNKRLPFCELEKSFADEWEDLNDRNKRIGENYGYGMLQDLFISGGLFSIREPRTVHKIINGRDRHIVATVIQWLGSNIGREFLNKCLKKTGYHITKID